MTCRSCNCHGATSEGTSSSGWWYCCCDCHFEVSGKCGARRYCCCPSDLDNARSSRTFGTRFESCPCSLWVVVDASHHTVSSCCYRCLSFLDLEDHESCKVTGEWWVAEAFVSCGASRKLSTVDESQTVDSEQSPAFHSNSSFLPCSYHHAFVQTSNYKEGGVFP